MSSINNGPDTSNSLGWSWKELNVASPIGEDVETSQVQFGDVNGSVRMALIHKRTNS
jgi:hypothetical protein